MSSAAIAIAIAIARCCHDNDDSGHGVVFAKIKTSRISVTVDTACRRRRRKKKLKLCFLDGMMLQLLVAVVVGIQCLLPMMATAFVTCPPPLHHQQPQHHRHRHSSATFTRSNEFSSTTRNRNTYYKRRAYFITPSVAATTTTTATTTTALHATNREQQQQQQQQEEEALSDVDARVLREILNDGKGLDLETEQGIRSLLKRGTVKTTVNPNEQQQAASSGVDDSPFASTAMKAFTDSKLWKKLSLQAEDLLESAKIWVANKVERDVQTLAALGLFAWDRVVKDVGRALPAAGTSARKLLLLTNTSSFNVMLVEQEEQAKSSKNRVSSLKEELNRPADEIKAVTRAIWDILSGESVDATTTNTRSLRTTAPAGLGNMAERQRRALKQRRKLDQQERDVTRVPASVIEAGYELQRELQAETSVAGYKTKPIRQAIQAGVVGTLKAVQETARLVAERGKKAERLAAATASSSAFLPQQQQQYMGLNKTALLLDLQQERLAIDLRLGKCIAEPENTWLTTDIVAQATMDLSEASLREIATFMVLVRDEMDAQVQADANDNVNVNAIDTDESVVIVDATKTTTTTSAMVQKVLDQLRADLKSIQELRSRVAGAVSFVIAEQLYSQILGLPSTTTSSSSDVDMQPEQVLPLVLRLDEFQEQLYAPPPPQAMPDSEDDYDTSTMPFTAPTKFVDVTNVKIRSSSSRISTGRDVIATAVADPTTTPSWRQSLSKATAAFIDFVDLIPDSVIDATMDGPETTATVGDAVAAFVDVGGKSFNAEIVTDDDFEIAVGGQPAKRVATFRGDDVDNDDGDAVSEPEQPNIVTVALLRSLDVVFFVVEKFFTVVVLKAVVIGTNVVRRLEETTWEGKGSRGWKPIRKTASAKGRY